MCTLFVLIEQVPGFPVVLLHNRDESLSRPTLPLHFWENSDPVVAGGRDLRGGGTWLGVTAGGRFAVLTNFRDPARHRQGLESRGLLVERYLRSSASPRECAALIEEGRTEHNGYSLVLGVGKSILCCSNVDGSRWEMTPGIHGLSNGFLNDPWPKVLAGKRRLEALVAEKAFRDEAFLDVMRNRSFAPDHLLPHTGIPREAERVLSPLFVATEKYGTRCTSLVKLDVENNTVFTERTYLGGGQDFESRTVIVPGDPRAEQNRQQEP